VNWRVHPCAIISSSIRLISSCVGTDIFDF
jgi:hypothetical protein